MSYLAQGTDLIDIEVGADAPIRISTTPVLFDSKVTTDPVEKPTAKIEAVDDDDLDDEEDEGEEKAHGPDTEEPF
jgi:hypothetical protein